MDSLKETSSSSAMLLISQFCSAVVTFRVGVSAHDWCGAKLPAVSDKGDLFVFQVEPGLPGVRKSYAEDAGHGRRDATHVDNAEILAVCDARAHGKEGGVHFGEVGEPAVRAFFRLLSEDRAAGVCTREIA